MSRKGRRPGNPDTRGEILDAARQRFATLGYEGASIRAIAAEAGVDPSLVLHYFESKEQLFVATLELPVNPAGMIRQIVDTVPPAELGEYLVATLLEIWDGDTDRNALVAALRSAVAGGEVADRVREFISTAMLAAFAERLPGPDPRLRAALIGSQIAGLLVARYILAIEPLASAEPAQLVSVYGPTIQRYAFDDLG
jgi:AcrR family transcriptional regulator